ncbi:hypothetical protein DNTS_034098 [Danionella cerebrum]|uniref:TIR domain-containing protein n=1 Tax=Danionella cerebrum TaxID=2873325 RepID=A0A553QZX6_9TELE|nr:hypothetical protein DNTS_034098 [Danionella translucida]
MRTFRVRMVLLVIRQQPLFSWRPWIYLWTAMRLGQSLYLTCLTFSLSVATDPLCSSPAEFKHDAVQSLSGTLGHNVVLTCNAFVNQTDSICEDQPEWTKDGTPLTNLTIYPQVIKDWDSDKGHIVSSELTLTMRDQADFESPSHTGAVVASVVLLLVLALAAVVYSMCRLNFKLWYKNGYGEYELNDGKIYDAFISYVNNENDRKFVNFILKPHLENKYSHKLMLNDTNILPGAEPSAELLMNISRCRRLIVVLSQSYLEQEWCATNFRCASSSHTSQPSSGVHTQWSDPLYLNTATPSSGFWKELALAMPRKMTFHCEPAGDPQTLLHGDKDPMLTQQPDYLDCRPDPDPAGDLGLRLPIYKTLSTRAPVLPSAPGLLSEAKPPEIDVSDLGSRDYAARTDFYCLVTEDDL